MTKRTAQGILLIGQWLTEVKERLPHGSWLSWLKCQFGWSQPTALNFMRVYDRFKLSNLDNLQIDVSALYLIPALSTPEPVVKLKAGGNFLRDMSESGIAQSQMRAGEYR